MQSQTLVPRILKERCEDVVELVDLVTDVTYKLPYSEATKVKDALVKSKSLSGIERLSNILRIDSAGANDSEIQCAIEHWRIAVQSILEGLPAALVKNVRNSRRLRNYRRQSQTATITAHQDVVRRLRDFADRNGISASDAILKLLNESKLTNRSEKNSAC